MVYFTFAVVISSGNIYYFHLSISLIVVCSRLVVTYIGSASYTAKGVNLLKKQTNPVILILLMMLRSPA